MKKYILLISSIITIWLTALFSLLPLNWLSQADVSNLYPTYITPAWFTFSIWSIIYLAWIIIWVYLIKWHNKISKKETYLFASAQLLSVIWLIPYHYKIISLTLIIILLILWILYYLVINPSKNKIFNKTTEIYFWWIFVASLLNIHLLLVFYDKYYYWVILWVISIVLWVISNIYLLRKYSTYISSVVLIWALLWIIISQTNFYITLIWRIGIILLLTSIAINIVKIEK
jgi:hypothetical protein